MSGKFGIGSKATARCELRGHEHEALAFHGTWRFKIFDKNGNLRDAWEDTNLITNQGLVYALQVALSGETTKPTSWFTGLITDATPTLAATDTLASKAWTEEQNYSEATRVLWQNANVVTTPPIRVTNAANQAVFTISQDGVTIGGSFLTESSIKGSTGAGDTLFSENAFTGGARTLNTGEILNIETEISVISA